MSALSDNVKRELANALDDKDAAMVVAEGKLFSIEVHDKASTNEEPHNLAQEIETYSKSRESLQRFLDNPDMKRYAAKELKRLRHDQRR